MGTNIKSVELNDILFFQVMNLKAIHNDERTLRFLLENHK